MSSIPNDATFIAERRLLVKDLETGSNFETKVLITEPATPDPSSVKFELEEGVMACGVRITAIDAEPVYFGADGIQALELATNLNGFFSRFKSRYNFCYLDGEPYEESKNE